MNTMQQEVPGAPAYYNDIPVTGVVNMYSVNRPNMVLSALAE